jgi:putative peptide zinc metalloprotease protein
MTPFMKEKLGTFLDKGATFCEIADVSKVKAEIPVIEYYIHDVRIGQDVELKLDAYPMETFHGQVQQIGSAIANRVESIEGTFAEFRVTVVVNNRDGRLIPGMKGYAKILGDRYSIAGRIAREVWRWIKSSIW